jgi:hypothetical protein
MLSDIFSKTYRQNSSIVFTAVVLILAMATITIWGSSVVNAQQQNTTKNGTFNHTQTDETGNPQWINTGNWSLTGIDSSSPTFEAVIDMAKPNGSAAHHHEVNSLSVTGRPDSQNNSTTTIQGTTTITMKDGPVANEPTTITLDGNQISLYFDPAKIDNHFGNQSIIGSVTK